MPGLLNAKQEPQPIPDEQPEEPSGMEEPEAPEAEKSNGGTQDPILKQIETGIEQAVPKELRKPYLSVVTAGMKVMFSQNTSQFMEQRLEQASDPVQAVSSGIADLLIMIYNESKRTMSIPAAMLAAFTLMAQALDYAEKIGKIEVTPDLVSQCADATWQAVTAKFGITKDKIDAVIAQSQGGQAQQDQSEQPQQGAQQGGLLNQSMMGA